LELSATPAVSPGKLAARPLYRDPPFDNPTDPVFTYNAETKKWFMYYTQRRGGGIALIHGTKIGIATSEDNGATWKYLGTAGITYGQDQHPADYTYWAPEVIWVADKYHMYLSYVPGIFTDWNHPREIVHLTSKDGIKWDTVGKVDLKSGKVIDACVIQLPDGNWRMFYKDEEKPMALSYADSPDLYKWETKGNAVTDRNGEGPKCIHWQGKYRPTIARIGRRRTACSSATTVTSSSMGIAPGGSTSAASTAVMPTSTGQSSRRPFSPATRLAHLPRPPLRPSRAAAGEAARPSTSSSSRSWTAN
jgi:hypothetical protein